MDRPTKFVVAWLGLLFVVCWFMSLGGLLGIHFWDPKYALNRIHEESIEAADDDDPFSSSEAIEEIGSSYYSRRRYRYFLPHVLGAFLWWNLYFLQLIPKLRRSYRSFHRYLGRFLMTVAIVQVLSGVGLAVTTPTSSIIKIVSICLAVAVLYCIYQAWWYAFHRDIPKHKYWATRLVGYLQTIALQRFWLLVLIVSHQAGWQGLYASFEDASDDEIDSIVRRMFDDSFVVCILQAILTTEWYLTTQYQFKSIEPSWSAIIESNGQPETSAVTSQQPLISRAADRQSQAMQSYSSTEWIRGRKIEMLSSSFSYPPSASQNISS